ncbi:MAG: c-type cytochrome [Alphaproteobacteria bacterium]
MLKIITFVIAAFSTALTSHAAFASEERDYGEYLAGECTSCHRDGSNETIPPIVGYEVLGFIELMETYRNGERQNQAMVSVAKSLDKEQIKALAVYFASLKPKQ